MSEERSALRQAIRDSWGMLSQRDRRKYLVLVALQSLSSILDLVGILLLGMLAGVGVLMLQGQTSLGTSYPWLASLGIGDWSLESLTLLVGALAATFLALRSVIAALTQRALLLQLSRVELSVSELLFRRSLSTGIDFISSMPSQGFGYALSYGASQATIVLLGATAVLISESSLILILGVALLALNPLATGCVGAFFLLVAVLLHRGLRRWSHSIGVSRRTADVAGLVAVQEATAAYKEVLVSGALARLVGGFAAVRRMGARADADQAYIVQLPKFIFESALVVGAIVLASILLATEDASAAAVALAIYLGVAARITPSLLRIQGALLGITSASAGAKPTFELWKQLHSSKSESLSGLQLEVDLGSDPSLASAENAFRPTIRVESVSYRYPGAPDLALSDVCLEAAAGSRVALVGPSGAGKSTLADLILGVRAPETGRVLLGGVDPHLATKIWPGEVAYMPQDSFVADATVRANLLLARATADLDDEELWGALQRAQLLQTILEHPLGLDAPVGERGHRLSGGQRQRLGLARALVGNPRLLVLDEPTSALDAETEEAVATVLDDIRGQCTVVIIAHRLSTVVRADQVVMVVDGSVRATGAYGELLKSEPLFASHVSIMQGGTTP